MTPKQFKLFLDRDQACYHCGVQDDTLVPQHRANRGHGGSKKRERLSNVIVFCSRANGLIESDPVLAETARVNGWKISGWADPLTVPVRDAGGVWWLLDDFGGRFVCDTPEIVA